LFVFQLKNQNKNITGPPVLNYDSHSILQSNPMKKISYMLIIFILIIPSFSQGQSTVKLYGVVVDAETGRPLEGVNITIAGTVYGTSSNRSGRFEF